MRKLKLFLYFCLPALSGVLMADIRFFWLDRPAFRDNPNDPKSPLYRTPTPRPTPTVPSPTPTPPNTPTPTATPSATPTISPTFTVTPTSTTSPFIYYDGDTAGATLDNVNRVTWVVTPAAVPAGTTFQTVNETNNGGPHSGLMDCRVAIATLGAPLASGVGCTPGASVNTSAYNGLSLWLRAPDGCFDATVLLHSPGAITATCSAAVTATAYTVDNGALDAGVWRHVVIPLAAFNGVNAWGHAYSLSACANLVDAVAVSPSFPRDFHYYAPGPYWVFRDVPPTSYNTSGVDIDDVAFVALSQTALRQFSPVFEPFTSPDGIDQWNGVWSTYVDAATCLTPTSAFSFPSPGSPPIDGIAGPLNSCFTGHISGTLGAADGATAPCTSTNLAAMGMAAAVTAPGATLNLTACAGLALTGGAIRGLAFYLKTGPSASPVDVDVIVRKASVAALNDHAHYRHRVPASQLGSGWIPFHVDFPSVGAMGTDMANSFGQPAWAAGAGASVAWDTTDVLQIAVAPADTARGRKFDIEVGQIRFY